MAKFAENILEFKDVGRFQQIPVTCVGDNWFSILGTKSVVHVKDSKIIHTWTLQGHLHHITSPVAYLNGYLYTVMDENVLLRWSEDDDNLESVEKVQLPEIVYTIISLHGSQPLIIFKSGKFALIDSTSFHELKPLDSVCVKDNDSIIWTDATVSSTNIEVFYLTSDKKVKLNTVYYFSVNKENKSVSPYHTYTIVHETSSLKSCCLNYQDLSFLSLWSDGTIRCCNVKDSKDTSLMSIQDIDQNTIVDINSIDSCIVIVKGKPRSEECVVEIHDARSSILKGRKELKTHPLKFLQVAATNDNIYINSSMKLMVIPYFVDSTFCSTLNTSETKGFEQLSWNADSSICKRIYQHSWNMGLEVVQIQATDEPEEMDTDSSKDMIQLIVEKLLSQDSSDVILDSDLAKILKIVISHKDESDDEKGYLNNKYLILNSIFSASITEKMLIYVKPFSIEETLIILNLLLSYLTDRISILKKPTDLQIVNWIYIILSSHMEALLFTKEKDVRKLLKNVQKAVSAKIEEYEDLEGIQNYYSVLLKKDMLPQQPATEKYCLETLNID